MFVADRLIQPTRDTRRTACCDTRKSACFRSDRYQNASSIRTRHFTLPPALMNSEVGVSTQR